MFKNTLLERRECNRADPKRRAHAKGEATRKASERQAKVQNKGRQQCRTQGKSQCYTGKAKRKSKSKTGRAKRKGEGVKEEREERRGSHNI